MDTNRLLVETPPKIQQWEYTSAHFISGEYDLPEINALGAEGWELCTLTEGETIDELIFKRPKQ
jgi:hypothetical protein